MSAKVPCQRTVVCMIPFRTFSMSRRRATCLRLVLGAICCCWTPIVPQLGWTATVRTFTVYFKGTTITESITITTQVYLINIELINSLFIVSYIIFNTIEVACEQVCLFVCPYLILEIRRWLTVLLFILLSTLHWRKYNSRKCLKFKSW